MVPLCYRHYFYFTTSHWSTDRKDQCMLHRFSTFSVSVRLRQPLRAFMLCDRQVHISRRLPMRPADPASIKSRHTALSSRFPLQLPRSGGHEDAICHWGRDSSVVRTTGAWNTFLVRRHLQYPGACKGYLIRKKKSEIEPGPGRGEGW